MQNNLEIIKIPDPRLKKLSLPITEFDKALQATATKMLELMKIGKGVGLAAPQVGLNLRMFVTNPTGRQGDDHVYVNPFLTDCSKGVESDMEGCLSIPGVRVKVDRYKVATISYQDLSGEPCEQTATGWEARIWQHETDHLDAILITDHAK